MYIYMYILYIYIFGLVFFQYTGAPVAPAYIEQIYGADPLKLLDTKYMNISAQLRAGE